MTFKEKHLTGLLKARRNYQNSGRTDLLENTENSIGEIQIFKFTHESETKVTVEILQIKKTNISALTLEELLEEDRGVKTLYVGQSNFYALEMTAIEQILERGWEEING